MKTKTINPWTWQQDHSYSQGVLVEKPQRNLYAAGQGSVDANGNLIHKDDVAAQARRAMENVETVLEAAGMSLSDVVRYDIHATDLQDYFIFGHAEVVKQFAEAGVVPAGGIATQ